MFYRLKSILYGGANVADLWCILLVTIGLTETVKQTGFISMVATDP